MALALLVVTARSRRPHVRPTQTGQQVEDAIERLGLAPPSVATIWRILVGRGFVTPQPHNAFAPPSCASRPTLPTSVGKPTSPTSRLRTVRSLTCSPRRPVPEQGEPSPSENGLLSVREIPGLKPRLLIAPLAAVGLFATSLGGPSMADDKWVEGGGIPQAELCTITGTSGDDRPLLGTAGPDVICGLDGDDDIRPRSGNDVVYAGSGNDTVLAGSGRDEVYGQGGVDDLFGGRSGGDVMRGGTGADTLYADRGPDRAYGDEGRDTLRAIDGRDVIVGGEDSDRLCSADGEGNDSLYGSHGQDRFEVDSGDFARNVEQRRPC